jgi:hypothetical protein
MKLLNTIIVNREMNMNVLPLCWAGPNRVLNSLCRVSMVLFHITVCREGVSQNMGGTRISPINVLVQFRDIFKILDEGSNTENRFLIIFSLLIWYLEFFVLEFWQML